MIWRHIFFRSRRAKAVLVSFLVYLLISTVYYFLPWSVRMPVYQKVPRFHRALMLGGYRLVTGWDELALFGRDANLELPKGVRGDLTYGGRPSQGMQIFGRVNVLENRGFVVGYSESLKNPLWVAYRVFDVPKLDSGKRPSRFKRDERTRAAVVHDDYTHSGYHRGHMAPNHAISTRYGPEGQKETFLMSNIIPQTSYVNMGIWKDLEMSVSKRYGRYFDEVWVITGPVFKEPVRKLDSGVSIPSHYYKIIIDEAGDELRVLAFLVASDCPPYSRIKKQLVSIDQLEELTGLDFFPALSKDSQKRLEAEPATRLWRWLPAAVHYHLSSR